MTVVKHKLHDMHGFYRKDMKQGTPGLQGSECWKDRWPMCLLGLGGKLAVLESCALAGSSSTSASPIEAAWNSAVSSRNVLKHCGAALTAPIGAAV